MAYLFLGSNNYAMGRFVYQKAFNFRIRKLVYCFLIVRLFFAESETLNRPVKGKDKLRFFYGIWIIKLLLPSIKYFLPLFN